MSIICAIESYPVQSIFSTFDIQEIVYGYKKSYSNTPPSLSPVAKLGKEISGIAKTQGYLRHIGNETVTINGNLTTTAIWQRI